MFNFYNLGPCRPCGIKNNQLYVKTLLDNSIVKFDIDSSSFFKTHTKIIDDKNAEPTSKFIMFIIEDKEGNTIIGRHDGSVTISKDGWLIGCTNWSRGILDYPHDPIGWHRKADRIKAIYLDPMDRQTLLVEGEYNYAFLEKPIPEDFEIDEVLVQLSLAKCMACDDSALDSYFVLGGDENAGIAQRCVAPAPGIRDSCIRVPT